LSELIVTSHWITTNDYRFWIWLIAGDDDRWTWIADDV